MRPRLRSRPSFNTRNCTATNTISYQLLLLLLPLSIQPYLPIPTYHFSPPFIPSLCLCLGFWLPGRDSSLSRRLGLWRWSALVNGRVLHDLSL